MNGDDDDGDGCYCLLLLPIAIACSFFLLFSPFLLFPVPAVLSYKIADPGAPGPCCRCSRCSSTYAHLPRTSMSFSRFLLLLGEECEELLVLLDLGLVDRMGTEGISSRSQVRFVVFLFLAAGKVTLRVCSKVAFSRIMLASETLEVLATIQKRILHAHRCRTGPSEPSGSCHDHQGPILGSRGENPCHS